MRITYLAHSGFFVQLDHAALLFDYWKGELPAPSDVPLFIFASHSHGDHFSPAIFDYGAQWNHVRWVLSDDISPEQVPAEVLDRVLFVSPEARYSLTLGGAVLEVETLRSTDLGVAFLLTTGGKTLYHAGDLHLWLWREDAQEDAQMRSAFEQYIEPLRSRHIDAGFLPLDPRQEQDAPLGLDYTARLADFGRIYPMHCWEDYSVLQSLLQDPRSTPYRNTICPIRKEGQTDEL